MIRKIYYSKIFSKIMTCFFALFFDRKFLRGEYFEKHRVGFFWALRSLPHILNLRRNKVRWPVHPNTSILCGNNIKFDSDSLNVFQNSGCYFQALGEIEIGKNVRIAQNVGIITANHDINNLEDHDKGEKVVISDDCWIGMNSVILPGVKLGEQTIVGAGLVVTKSFKEGHCVIAGNPARIIRKIYVEA